MPIYDSRKNAKYWRLFITMVQFFGSRCLSLNQHVKLTFGIIQFQFFLSLIEPLLHANCRRFPYDRQNCSMKFGAWTYDMSKVNLTFYRDIQQFDLKSYVKSNEWNIIGNSASRNTEKYGRIKFLY